MTRQEMFNKAVRGLRSQGFRRCTDDLGRCLYSDNNGRHCAWGWVDEASWDAVGTVRMLPAGIAATLNDDDLDWAVRLQSCHDKHDSPAGMEEVLRKFADDFNLTWPEGP